MWTLRPTRCSCSLLRSTPLRCFPAAAASAATAASVASVQRRPLATATFSRLIGRRGLPDPPPSPPAHARILSRAAVADWQSEHYSARVSPWIGRGNEAEAGEKLLAEDEYVGPLRRSEVQPLYYLRPLHEQRGRWVLAATEADSAYSAAASSASSAASSPHSSPSSSSSSRWRFPSIPVAAPKALRRRAFEWVVSLGLISASLAFYYTHLETVPVTNRRHFVALPRAWDSVVGGWMARSYLEGRTVLTDPSDLRVQLVRAVGERIAASSGQTGWDWQFHVVVDPAVNAFCCGGGKVVVNTGMLDALWAREVAYHARMRAEGREPVENALGHDHSPPGGRRRNPFTALARRWSKEVAIPPEAWPWPETPQGVDVAAVRSISERLVEAVQQLVGVDLGAHNSDEDVVAPLAAAAGAVAKPGAQRPHPHEVDARDLRVERGLLKNQLAVVMAHEVAHAVARHTSEKLSVLLPLMIMQWLNSLSPLLSAPYTFLYTLPHSRMHEREADELGLALMARACFHPGSAASFWADFHSAPEAMHYFSSHPADAYRARDAHRGYHKAKAEMQRCCR